jgi:hypothetical protein
MSFNLEFNLNSLFSPKISRAASSMLNTKACSNSLPHTKLKQAIKIGISFVCALFLIACEEENSDALAQHLQAHELNIIAIEIEPSADFVSRTLSETQFKAYGILPGGERLMTEAPSNGSNPPTMIDRNIADLVNWSVDNQSLASISNNGLFTSFSLEGTPLVTASLSTLTDDTMVTISSAELASLEIQGDNQVDVCRNITLTAIGVLTDGNQVELTNTELVWSVETPTNFDPLAEFKNPSVGLLSTYLDGTAQVKLKDNISEVSSELTNVAIYDSLLSISVSDRTELTAAPGESLEVIATGLYNTDEEVDITLNSSFESREPEIASFENNILTVADDAKAGDSSSITISCNNVFEEITLNVLDPS